MPKFLLRSCLLLACLASAGSAEDDVANHPQIKDWAGVFALDGSFVHTAGELQMNVTNWGLLGSRPGFDSTYSKAPSAMWPAGSGIDFLFAAGPWIGAVRDGVPLVSTGQFENELMPSPRPEDTVYEVLAGDPHGHRYPFAPGDDDGDSLEDEDPRDGYDNDDDGRIDEDYAAIATQSFRARMVDNNPIASELWVAHEPLDIEVIQQTHQWDSDRLEDCIAIEYTIRNIGTEPLEDVAFGFFADPDIGPREGARPGQDDLVGFRNETAIGTDGLPLSYSLAYMYDCPGVDGDITGYIGFVILNTTTPPTFHTPATFRWFTRNVPFERGGEPTNDADRYTLMTQGGRQSLPLGDCAAANDYRLLIATNPSSGRRLMPGAALTLQMGIVMGFDLIDLRENAAALLQAYLGRWYDRDGDASTGLLGREMQLCPDEDFDPRQAPNPFLGLEMDCGDPVLSRCNAMLYFPRVVEQADLDENGCVWINGDCALEFARGRGLCSCYGRQFDFLNPDIDKPCTGREGKEHNVKWIAQAPPPSPRLRTWQTAGRVHLFWSDEVETYVDELYGLPAFEGYRIWRADDWERPPGTSILTGPNSELWKIVAEFDVVDDYERIRGPIRETLPLGTNTGLDHLIYTPAVLRAGSEEAREFAQLRSLCEIIVAQNPTMGRGDAVRYRDNEGALTNFGRDFPELAQWECCPDVTDTLVWNELGVRWYEYVDRDLTDGIYYFHSVTTTTRGYSDISDEVIPTGFGVGSNPRGNFEFTVPQSRAQSAPSRATDGHDIYVVPNPATRRALADFSQLRPNEDDPTGVRIEFRNLPAARNRVRIFTLSGDLVAELSHDGRNGSGSLPWNLVSRKGQEIVSGIYLYSVSSEGSDFDRVIGRFVVIR